MPRKKTETEKKKAGTARADRRKKAKVHVLQDWPQPDIEMNETEQMAYAGLCRHLEEAGTLFDVDRHLMTLAAVNIAQGVIAMNALRERGPIQEFDNGTRNVSPEYSIFEKCMAAHIRYSRLLGLDPRSRADLEYFLEKETKEVDPIEEAMKTAMMRRVK